MPPPRTRGRSTKTLKENASALSKGKSNKGIKSTRSTRKPFADKTNSTSDDNTSTVQAKKLNSGKVTKNDDALLSKVKRNTRRLATLVQEPITKGVGQNKLPSSLQANTQTTKSKINSPSAKSEKCLTESSQQENISVNQPKRSPRKAARVDYAALADSKKVTCKLTKLSDDTNISKNDIVNHISPYKELPTKSVSLLKEGNQTTPKDIKKKCQRNDNDLMLLAKTSPLKPSQPKKKTVLSKSKDSNLDIYEFTFDPSEEPPPQKKKKRTVRKKPAAPKARTVIYKNNYDKNVAKALSALKVAVSKKTQLNKNTDTESNNAISTQNIPKVVCEPIKTIPAISKAPVLNNSGSNIPKPSTNGAFGIPNHHSVRVEDIAADFEPDVDCYNDLDYSPVNSPHRSTPVRPEKTNFARSTMIADDPLNLKGDASFFDERPLANSSMIMPTRLPEASPWRAEFNNLPIKWQVNSYVKANMTPAVESSFMNYNDDNKKKHVYTNMLPETDHPLPQIIAPSTPNLKQTSIISFIKEVVERSANKKKKTLTPVKSNSMFDDSYFAEANKTPSRDIENKNRVNDTCNKDKSSETSSDNNDILQDKEDSIENREDQCQEIPDKENKRLTRKRKNEDIENETSAKTPRKEKGNELTFFGFDESSEGNIVTEASNQQNMRRMRSKSRGVLKEINQKGPTRVIVPKSKFALGSEAVEKVYQELKSATDAPVFPEKNVVQTNVDPVNINEPNEELNDDSQSVHLFEDLDVVHHMKPIRKSYGKPKKVMFQENASDSDSDEEVANDNQGSEYEDDLADLSYKIPAAQPKRNRKKPTKKQLMSKKEEREIEEWAAGFNSMCEDVEGFDLVVE